MWAKKLCIGGAQFGNDYGINRPVGGVGLGQTREILRTGAENGIRRVDTAPAYGSSEEFIGRYLLESQDQNWHITTKVSGTSDALALLVQESVRRLTRRPDLILAHDAQQYLFDSHFRKSLRLIANKHQITKIGVSLYDPELVKLFDRDSMPDAVQIPVNLLDRRFRDEGCIDKFKDVGVDVHARSIFLQGLLFLPKSEICKRFPSAGNVMKKVEAISKEEGISIASLSLLSTISDESIDRVILGVDSSVQLARNIQLLHKVDERAFHYTTADIGHAAVEIVDPRLWNFR